MATPVRTYGFINAKLRARISEMLDMDFFSRMIRSRSFIEAMSTLRGTEYSEIDTVYGQTGDLKMAELELYRRELRVLRGVERYVEGTVLDFVRALTTRYEIEELKNALRLWFERVVRGRSVESKIPYLLREPVHYEINWDGIVNAPSIEQVAEELDGTPYRTRVEQNAAEVERRASLFPLETALDRHFYEGVHATVEALDDRDRDIAERLLGIEVDLANVEWIVRYKAYYELPAEEAVARTLPFGRTIDQATMLSSYQSGNPAEKLGAVLRAGYPGLAGLYRSSGGDSSRLAMLESLMNELLLREVHRTLGGYPFTIGIVLSYFVLKQTEIRRIMTILNAKYYDVTQERIERLL